MKRTIASWSLLFSLLGSWPASALAAQPAWPEPTQLPAEAGWPDPLILQSGKRAATLEEWNTLRRPELKALFAHYMYGPIPPVPPQVQHNLERVDRNYFGGKATKKEVTLSFGAPNLPRINLLVVIPNHRERTAPVFLGMNFCGNHAVVNDPTLPLSKAWSYDSCPGCTNNRATESSRGGETARWAIEQSIDRGYAVAVFYSGDVVPDRPDQIGALRAAFAPLSQGQTNDFGAIAAWAWGFHRCVDYLVTDRELDPKRIIAVGHSRNGKTALLAAAFDERIAMSIPLQAGCGGTAPSRGKVGESVKQINDRFPHWFNGAFKEFNDHPERLPFDQHALIALCAPRPVLLANAVEDQWANPNGQFEMLKAADAVYRLAGTPGLQASTMPEVNQLAGGPLGYFIRPGKHSMTAADWKIFIDFAEQHFGKPRP